MNNKNAKNNQIVDKYKKIFEDTERLPISRDFTDEELDIINQDLGGLSKLKKLYIPSNARPHGNTWITEEKVIGEIRALAKELGYPPHNSDYLRANTALNKFGAPWSNVLKHCGIKGTYKNGASISKEEVIAKTKKAMKKYGRFLNWQELSKEHVPVAFIYVYWDDFDHFCHEFGNNLSQKQRYQSEVKMYDTAMKELINKGDKFSLTELLQKTNTTREQFLNFLGKERCRGNLESRSVKKFFSKYGINYDYVNSITLNGVKYKSLRDASEQLGITETTLKKRIKWFGPNSKWLTYKSSFSNKYFVKIGDTVYPSLSVAADELGINRDTLRTRFIRYGNDLDKLLTKGQLHQKNIGKPVTICGKQYKHISAASKELNISAITLLNRIKRFGPNDPRVLSKSRVDLYKA